MNEEVMKYEVHLVNGEVWYCRDIVSVLDVMEPAPECVDTQVDVAMTEAIEKRYIDTDEQPTTVFLSHTPVAIKVISKTIVAGWHRNTQTRLENFA